MSSTNWVGTRMKFVYRFSCSVIREMMVSDEPPPKGTNHIHELKWSGQPKLKHLREYVRWSHVVNEHLAKLWNLSLIQFDQVGPDLWEDVPMIRANQRT